MDMTKGLGLELLLHTYLWMREKEKEEEKQQGTFGENPPTTFVSFRSLSPPSPSPPPKEN